MKTNDFNVREFLEKYASDDNIAEELLVKMAEVRKQANEELLVKVAAMAEEIATNAAITAVATVLEKLADDGALEGNSPIKNVSPKSTEAEAAGATAPITREEIKEVAKEVIADPTIPTEHGVATVITKALADSKAPHKDVEKVVDAVKDAATELEMQEKVPPEEAAKAKVVAETVKEQVKAGTGA